MKSFFWGILGGIASNLILDWARTAISNQSIQNFIKRTSNVGGAVVIDFVYASPTGLQFVGEQDASTFSGTVSKQIIRSLREIFPDQQFDLVPTNQAVSTL